MASKGEWKCMCPKDSEHSRVFRAKEIRKVSWPEKGES